MLTIGTAGHIDHGKSSLVKALTSIDPDRLPEEKLRGMTLDLGFAWMELPSGEKVGIIDVPGHEHFVRNVIPGMSGIDGVILLVAADDGWMPQTEEHMQIINLLGISHGIIALNKIDMVSDPEWLEMVEAEIIERTRDTTLAGSPIVRVSARDGTGIEQLKAAIVKMVAEITTGRDIGRPRLPVDRVFTIKGSGVVVTGTLNSGSLGTGDEVVILPAGLKAHVRGVECYKEFSQKVEPGCRVALNLTGVKKEDISRGDVIVAAGGDQSISSLINVEVRLLPHPEFRLKNGEEVLVYMETGEYISRVALIDARELAGGQSGLVHLKLSSQAPVYIGQRLIVRRQSPADTIGGGVVLDPFAPAFKTRHAAETAGWLNRRRSLDVDSLVMTELERRHFADRKGFLACTSHSDDEIQSVLDKLIGSGALRAVNNIIFPAGQWEEYKQALLRIVEREHQANPLKRGAAQAAVQGELGLAREIFTALTEELAASGELVRLEDFLALSGHKPQASGKRKALVEQIIAEFESSPFSPPSFKDLATRFPGSEDLIYFLIGEGRIMQLSDGILIDKDVYNRVKDGVVAFLKKNGTLAIQDLNKMFGFSRKYSLPILGQLDKEKVTRREGDLRVLV